MAIAEGSFWRQIFCEGSLAQWHIIGKTYENSSSRLKIRDVDRYKFWSATGQTTREVVIKLKGLASESLVYVLSSD